MMRRKQGLGHVVSIVALSAGLLGLTSSCDDDSNPVGGICDALEECPASGVAKGNAAITGYVAVDSFFGSVVNFRNVAAGVSADVQAELDGIQTSFGVSNADLAASGGKLGAAIKAKIDTKYKAKLVIKAQPAKCEVNASFSAEATAKCQAEAKCDVKEGKASVSCMGTCTVEASAEAKCEADAEVVCNVTAPDFECKGSCEGTCTAELAVAASCTGNCVGECSGTCMGDTDTGAGCNGQCMGMCKGKCEASGMAALECSGKCSGSCSYKPGMASCDARAKVECELKAEAKAECSGRCEGEFEPPKVDCSASASCEASAKAEAKFSAKCTPPSIDVRWTFDASVTADVKADFDFRMADIKARLPRLKAALAKADLVVKAGTELGDDGAKAIEATLDGIADGDIDAALAVRIGKCAPSQLKASAGVVTEAGKDLSAKLSAGNEVAGAIGM
jgi:hypothetical protein